MTVSEALELVARALQAQCGDKPIPVAELRRQAAQMSGHRESSVIPSDFCYNRTNAGVSPSVQPMFVQEGRGLYRYVGVGYRYTGPVMHKPRGEAERQVGQWRDGELTWQAAE